MFVGSVNVIESILTKLPDTVESSVNATTTLAITSMGSYVEVCSILCNSQYSFVDSVTLRHDVHKCDFY